MPLGIGLKNLDPNGMLLLTKEVIIAPPASSATLLKNAMDISASVSGDAITLEAAAAAPLPVPRKLLMTATDASGSSLAVSVLIVGRRFGRRISETLSTTGAGAQTATSTKIYDELTSATIVSISGNAASDTLSLGTNSAWLGLNKPIKSYKSVRLVHRITSIDASPVSTATPKMTTDLSTSLVLGGMDSAIDVSTLFSAAIAATQVYQIEYFADGEPDFVTRLGKKYG